MVGLSNNQQEQIIIAPQSKFQSDYLNSDATILVAGGAAGSSKTYIGLMRHLRWVNDPNYVGFCIRKNTTAIMKSGGLFDEAVGLYRQFDPKLKIKMKDQRLVFTSGASITFSHYENRNASQMYQGLQISGIMYDEASHAEDEDIWWLISRLRSKANMSPSIWLTCNPDFTSYLMKYVRWYLYPEGHDFAGRPDPEKNGNMRWLIRVNGDIVWAETKEELLIKYGDSIRPISFQGLFGNIHDNPALLKNSPEYLSNLLSLPRVDQERLYRGNWFAREESSGYFKREWTPIESLPPVRTIGRCRAWDLASSLPSEATPNPDWTVGTLVSKDPYGEYYVEDVNRFRDRPHGVLQQILLTAEHDGRGTTVLIPADPGAAGRAYAQQIVRELTERGFYARIKTVSNSKVNRFAPFAALCEAGGVKIVRGTWNEAFFNELERFDGSRNIKDDIVDSVSDAWMELARKNILCKFELPTGNTKSNPFQMK